MEGDSRQEEEAGEIRGVEKGGNANGIGRAASGTREASEARVQRPASSLRGPT